MKKIISASALILLLLIPLLLVSCGMKITFMVNGEEYATANMNATDFNMPKDPQMEGMTFVGWFFDKDIWEQPFTLDSLKDAPIKENTSVYAYFVEEGSEQGQATLTFNTLGGSEIEPQTLLRGAKPKTPTDPTFDGYYFCGWYEYPDYQTPFSFDQPLKQDTTVYAKWALIGSTSLASVDFETALTIAHDPSFHSILEKDEKTYVVYKLGTMKNVILGQKSDIIYHISGTDGSVEYSDTNGTERSVSTTVEHTLGHSAGFSMEVSVGPNLPFVNASMTLSANYSREESWSDAFTQSESVYSEKSKGAGWSLKEFSGEKYYGIFVVGSQEVFQYFIYENGEWTGKSGLTAREIGKSAVRILSCQDGNFIYSEDSYLEPMAEPDLTLLFGGNGTASSPYCVGNVAQLYAINFSPNSHYKLTKNISLSDVAGWEPIGGMRTDDMISFSGVLDGCGYSISGLTMTFPSNTSFNVGHRIGLFGTVTGTVKNLTLKSFNITVSSNHAQDGWIEAGALCGRASGALEKITVDGCSITIHRDFSNNGGLVGVLIDGGKAQNITVKNSTVYGNGDVAMVVGVAKNNTLVSGCTVSNCTAKYYAVNYNRCTGGVVGNLNNSRLENCTVTGTTFCFAGSDRNGLHDYNIFGGHHYCSLQPHMGYLVGHATGANTVLDLRNCKQESNAKTFESSSDDRKRITGSNNESKAYFKAAGGMSGRVSEGATVLS